MLKASGLDVFYGDVQVLWDLSFSVGKGEVVALIGEGIKNKEIADRLFISETTVRHHLTSIYAKLNVTDRVELLIYAFRHGLASPPPSRR